jgi:drug/metabolite transporter (DMT)-like permease
MANRRTLAIVEVTLAVVFWGASFIATKVALREVSPETVVWLRFLMGMLILGVAMFARREFALPSPRDLAYFAVLGFIGITFHQWLQSTGLVTAQASTTAWIVATTPIFIALLSWLFLKERLGKWGVVGIALATFGVLLTQVWGIRHTWGYPDPDQRCQLGRLFGPLAARPADPSRHEDALLRHGLRLAVQFAAVICQRRAY